MSEKMSVIGYLNIDSNWKTAVTILSLVFAILLLVTAILGWTTFNEPAPASSNRTFFIIMTFLALGGITVAALKVAADFGPNGALGKKAREEDALQTAIAKSDDVAAKVDEITAVARKAAKPLTDGDQQYYGR